MSANKVVGFPSRDLQSRRLFAPVLAPQAYDCGSIGLLLNALGGNPAVADYCRIVEPVVASWTVRNELPVGWHLRFLARAIGNGKTVNPLVFGYERQDEEAQALAWLMNAAKLARDGGAHV